MSTNLSNPDSEEDYFLPLEDQRVFGAGIKRKRIAFVSATSEHASSAPIPTTTTKTEDAGNRYLAIVMRGDKTATDNDNIHSKNVSVCEVCKLPVTLPTTPISTTTSTPESKPTSPAPPNTNHESSIAHQICLQHSHPPSHLDRKHIGLKYLSSYGWNPDARAGLGARNEGIRAPVKAREKRDTVGLGHGVHDEDDVLGKKSKGRDKVAKITKVDAKEVRKLEDQKKRKAERLRESFYGEDLSMYLGPNG